MNKLEREIEKKFKHAMESLGCIVLKFTSPQNAGVPDRIVLIPGGIALFAEIKQSSGRLTPLQQVWRERLHTQKCLYALVNSEAAVKDLAERVKRIQNLSVATGDVMRHFFYQDKVQESKVK